jgi:hypothetical protein
MTPFHHIETHCVTNPRARRRARCARSFDLSIRLILSLFFTMLAALLAVPIDTINSYRDLNLFSPQRHKLPNDSISPHRNTLCHQHKQQQKRIKHRTTPSSSPTASATAFDVPASRLDPKQLQDG